MTKQRMLQKTLIKGGGEGVHVKAVLTSALHGLSANISLTSQQR